MIVNNGSIKDINVIMLEVFDKPCDQSVRTIMWWILDDDTFMY